jgi:NodT family efflux transporter outer membrane factor (OMF) lipoprotein
MTPRRTILTVCCAISAAAGCAARDARLSAPEPPPVYEHATDGSGSWPSQTWYRDFGSDELNAIIDQAAKSNWDLAQAGARVSQADARARQAGAALLPSLDANGNANFLSGHSSQGGGHELDWAALLSASYEVDFWGKNRAAADSARWLAGASRAERDTVALTTLAGVASSYFQVLAVRQRLAIARSNSEAARQLLDVVQWRFNAGFATPVDLATQRTAFDAAQIAVADIEQSEVEARARLSLLLGREPEHFDVLATSLDSLHEPAVAPGLPSELLTRRPDILAAETNLRAGHADLLAARAALFPNLSLTASAGVQNPALPAVVLTIPGVGPSFGLGANLVQPIFDHGRLKAQRDEVQAKELELLAAYRASIISAFSDVENSLAAIHHLDQSRGYQQENVTQSERAFDGAKLRYQAGSADFLILLEAQRTLYAARSQFVDYKLARLQALVGLSKALGGGWAQQQIFPGAARPMTGKLDR